MKSTFFVLLLVFSTVPVLAGSSLPKFGRINYINQHSLKNGDMLCMPTSAANAILYLSEKYNFSIPRKFQDTQVLVDFITRCSVEHTNARDPHQFGMDMYTLSFGLNTCLKNINPGLEVGDLMPFMYRRQIPHFPMGGEYGDLIKAFRDGGVAIVSFVRYNQNFSHPVSGHGILAYDWTSDLENKTDSYQLNAIDPSVGYISYPLIKFVDNSTARGPLDMYYLVEGPSMNPEYPAVLSSAMIISYKARSTYQKISDFLSGN